MHNGTVTTTAPERVAHPQLRTTGASSRARVGGHGTVTDVRRAIVYCRISEDREESFGGVDNQEGMCLRLAEELGWHVVRIYVENDTSAASGKRRPEYDNMLRDLRSGVADAVLAAHPDRLHRRPIELEEFINLCEEKGVVIRTRHAGEMDLNTASGRLVARMLGAAARAEVDRMIERGRDHKDKMAADGKWRGGPRPYGFEPDGVTIREDESLVVKDMIHRFLAGESINALTKEMNGCGRVTTFGKPWTTAGFRTVIRRARNAGIVENTRTGDLHTAVWPAIVSESDWRRVNAILDDPTRRVHDKGATPTNLGTNIYQCGVCGSLCKGTATMAGKHRPGESRAGKGTYRIYACKAHRHLTRKGDPVDSYVREAVREGLRDGYALRVLLADAGEDTAALHDRATEIRAEIDELAALKVQKILTLSQVVTMTEALRKELTRIQGQLAAVTTSSALVGIADDPEPVLAFNTAPLSTQRAVLKAMYEVTLLPQNGHFRSDDPGNPYPRFDERTVVLRRRVDAQT